MRFLLIATAVVLLTLVARDTLGKLELLVIHERATGDNDAVQLIRALASEFSREYNPSDSFIITEFILPPVYNDSYTGVREYCDDHSGSDSLVIDMTTECRYQHITHVLDIPYWPTSQCNNQQADQRHVKAVVIWAQTMLQSLLGLPAKRVTAFLFIRSSNSSQSLFTENPPADVSTVLIDIDDSSWRIQVDKVIALSNIRTFVIVGNQETHDSVMKKICELALPIHPEVVSISFDPVPMTCQSCRNVSFTYFVSQSPGHIEAHADLTAYFTDVLDALFKWWKFRSTLSSTTVDRCNKLEGVGTNADSVTSMVYSTALPFTLGFKIEHHNCSTSDDVSVQTWFWHPTNGTNISRVQETITPTALRVLTIVEAPFTFKDMTSGGSVVYSGFSVDVIKEIGKRMRFNYHFSERADGKFGILLPDGSWSGMIGELIKGTADLAIGPISVTSKRAAVVDFTIPFYDLAGIQILIKKMDTGSSMFAFITVFSGFVWLTWAGLLVVMAGSLLVFDKISPFSLRNSLKLPEGESHHRSFNAKQSMWFVVTSFTLAGPDNFPVSISSRVLAASFWLTSVILMSSYTASFAARITLSRLSAPVQSLDELAAQTKIKFSTLHDSSMQEYFSRMAFIERNFFDIWKEMSYQQTSSVDNEQEASFGIFNFPLGDKFTRIWTGMTGYGFWNSSEEAVLHVLEGNFAYFQESPMVQYNLAKYCDLTTVGATFSAKPYAIALKKNSPLTKQISEGILQLQQERVMETLKKKWWPDVADRCPVVTDNKSGISLYMMAGTFIIIIFGVVLGIITLVGEVLLHRATIHRKNQKQQCWTDTYTNSVVRVETRESDNCTVASNYTDIEAFEKTEF